LQCQLLPAQSSSGGTPTNAQSMTQSMTQAMTQSKNIMCTTISEAPRLNEKDVALISKSDTFFIASSSNQEAPG
jgi:hypothetical protein